MKKDPIRFGFIEGGMFLFLSLVTMVALYLSYFMELVIYRSIFDGMDYVIFKGITITVFFAATFNAAKLGVTWILSYLKVTDSSRLLAIILRIILVCNSLLMTVFIVTGQFSAPNAEKVHRKELAQIEDRFHERQQAVESGHHSALSQLKLNYDLEVTKVKELYFPDLHRASDGMEKEMGNVQGGVWDGSRYKEWKSKHAQTKALMDVSLLKAMDRYQQAVAEQNHKFDQKLEKISGDKLKAFEEETIEKHLNRYESQNKHVVALIDLINMVTGASIGAHHIVFLVSILITAIIEFVPLLLGGYLFTRVLSLEQARKEPTEVPEVSATSPASENVS